MTLSLFHETDSVIHSCIPESGHSRYSINEGTALFHIHDPFTSLYLIISGFFKTTGERENLFQQVLDFHFPKEIIGLDGIDIEQHNCNAFALQDSVVMRIPFINLETSDEQTANLRHEIYVSMSEELNRERNSIFNLGSKNTRRKLASFLIQLSDRFKKLGYSQSEFNLFMTRTDIASYLGVTNETISRTLTQFINDELIAVNYRNVRILDREELKKQM